MRYRFSWWDIVILLLFVGFAVAGVFALRAGAEAVPLHYGGGGQPTRWGAPTFMNVVGLPLLLLLITYFPIRLVDLLYVAASSPVQYGFTTNLGGGLAVITAVLVSPMITTPLFGTLPAPWFLATFIGLIYVFLGAMLILTPPEKIIMNMGGVVADTTEGRWVFSRSMGISCIMSGIAFVPADLLLPGQWSMLGTVPLLFGPIAGMIVGIVKAPKPPRN